jgi:hypothetical protein
LRLGPGPVFVYEWLATSRRWQLYGLRAGFVGAILIGMMFVWHEPHRYSNAARTVSIQTLARYGEELYKTIVSIELTLVLLAAPAVTAGAICLDKARGTLDHMLATDLSNAEIVLGKIGVRLVPVIGLTACVFPVTALSGMLGGIDPLALLGSFLTAIACAVLGCSLALTLSVVVRACPGAHRSIFVSVSPRPSLGYHVDRMGMDRVFKPLLSCLCTLFGSQQGGSYDVCGFPGILSRRIGIASGTGDAPDSRRGTETSRPSREKGSSWPFRSLLPPTEMARPVAKSIT